MSQVAPVAAPAVRTETRSMTAELQRMPRAFWMVNLMEMIERLAYYGVRVVIPIYIAQADEIHGLHFTQLQKGQIFMLVGAGPDRRAGVLRWLRGPLRLQEDHRVLDRDQDGGLSPDGHSARSTGGSRCGCLVLAFGTAIFKPGLWGTLLRT